MSLQIRRVFDAPVERVYKAFTDSNTLISWFSPEGMTTPKAIVDLQVGGSYEIVMHNTEGNEDYTARGEFQEIVDNRRLVLSWKWDDSENEDPTTLTIEFNSVDPNVTEVTLTHEGFKSEESEKQHREGWESSFNKLERVV